MKFVEYPDREMMMIDLANILASELENCLLQHEHASFAVPGGTTPGPIFDTLCAVGLDWSRVHVFLTDERWVPETSERSNTRLLKERLLIENASEARFIPFYRGGANPEDDLEAAAEELKAELPVSVMLLGLGADMHTASLFPGADKLEEALAGDAPPVMAMRAPGAPEARITLTAPVLKGAMSRHIVITGGEKRQAMDRAVRTGDPMLAPAAAILPGTVVHWAE
ncbi:MAG: 6-phosphogluconolactonase [Pseudomonadota bacterium]